MTTLRAPLIAATLQYLPIAVQAGADVAALVSSVISKPNTTPSTATERYAEQVLAQVPSLLKTGGDVYSILSYASEKLAQMQKEGNRPPSSDEWAELNAQIHSQLTAINAAANQSADGSQQLGGAADAQDSGTAQQTSSTSKARKA